jgi:hypothetical protein
MKKFGWVILILAMGVWGCVSVDHTTVVDADHSGYANGQYRDVRSGKVCDVSIYGGGAAASAASTATGLVTSNILTAASAATTLSSPSNSSSSGGGGGLVGIRIRPPAQGDPMPFAKAIATINYSKKLKNISYDEISGQVNYQFGEPDTRLDTRPRSSTFGHQPIQ